MRTHFLYFHVHNQFILADFKDAVGSRTKYLARWPYYHKISLRIDIVYLPPPTLFRNLVRNVLPQNHGSEGFPNGIFHPCALWARGVARLNDCRHVVAAVGVIWRFRSTFWPGNYIWSLPLWNWALVKVLDPLGPGFCIEFRYLLYGQSGLAWGAIFEKITKYQENHLFKKWACPKNQEMLISGKKSRPRPMTHGVSYKFQVFYRHLKKCFFPQIHFLVAFFY